uniref:ATPase F1/V1/A1 complex alpha/beta subunit N-terminal domain-containing protein n=1 Tax=Ananas comosus var. bracteatus TaxID=296719 RepID=A0A6V7P4H2_ANACO|nr:unnamed protein product [Ananas comosus var. bracteatus]
MDSSHSTGFIKSVRFFQSKLSRFYMKKILFSMFYSIREGHTPESRSKDCKYWYCSTSSSNGIARIHGLDEVMTGELVEFEECIIGIALNMEANNVDIVLMGDVYVPTYYVPTYYPDMP